MRLPWIVALLVLSAPALAAAQGHPQGAPAHHGEAHRGEAHRGEAHRDEAHRDEAGQSAAGHAGASSPGQREVELIEAGEGPLRPLRHHFTAGQSARFRAHIRQGVTVSSSAGEQSVPMPPMVIEVEVGPTEVTHGHLRYPFRFTGATLEEGGSDEVRERLEHDIGGLVGTHGRVEIDDRGAVVDFQFELPAGASQQIQQQASALRTMIGQLLPRLPREPVGVGARWRIRDTAQLPQMSIEVASVYELRRWEGDRINLALTISRGEGGAQLPEGVEVDITGNGRTLMRLGSLAVRQRAESRLELDGPTAQGRAHVVMTSSQQLTPAH